MMRWFVFVLVVLLAGCRAPAKLIDKSRVETSVDSGAVKSAIVRVDTGFVVESSGRVTGELVTEYYKPLPDSLQKPGEPRTYLYKKESYKGTEESSRREERKGERVVEVRDSVSVKKTEEVQNDVEQKRSRAIPWGLVVCGLGVLVLVVLRLRR